MNRTFQNILVALLCMLSYTIFAQPVPAGDENIPFLMTFGKDADPSWGDDDFSQVFFFTVPKDYNQPFFIKVFDADIGGENDEIRGDWNTMTSFEVYGGDKCYTAKDAKNLDPIGDYKSGTLLRSKSFGVNPRYDNNWYTFGPFNPAEGEFVEVPFNVYYFKVVIEGISGDDGNLYRFFLSTSRDENIPIEGGNGSTFEYSFRMWNNSDQVSHIYPYIDEETTSVTARNFDWDNDGLIKVVSVARKGQLLHTSGENVWKVDNANVMDLEKNKSWDMQFIKRKSPLVKNNNVVMSIQNQRGESLEFFAVPIGGVPKYQYNIGVRKK